MWGLDGNVLSRSTYQRGDVDAALAASAHVVHEVFETQRIEHAFLEPESTLVEPRADGTLMVWSGGQGVWDDRNQIASVLAINRTVSSSSSSPTAARSGQGGHVEPGADRTGGLALAAPGEVHDLA